MTDIEKELKNLGVTYDGYSVLQNKDGITVARISDGKKSYILKHFEKEEHRREIKNYSILMSLNIPTADVLAANESSLLLRDIAESDTLRLGTKKICLTRMLPAGLPNGTKSFTNADTNMLPAAKKRCLTKRIISPRKILIL